MKIGTSRMIQLDVLRGVAILLVIFTHAVVQPADAGGLRGPLEYIGHLGPTGVDLFFVLSGFLVGGLLFAELQANGRLDVRRFLIRRAFRIWPSYFVFLAVLIVGLMVAHGDSLFTALRSIWPSLLHVQNYFGSPRPQTWSLAIEEHFYLALPLLLLLLTARTKSRLHLLPWIALGLSITCTALRLNAYLHPPWFNPHIATHLRIDSLFFGVMLAYLYHCRAEALHFSARARRWLISAAMLVLIAFPLLFMLDASSLILSTGGFVLLYVCYGTVVIILVQSGQSAPWLGQRPLGPLVRTLAFIGFYSYPIYLWHIDASGRVPLAIRDAARAMGPELYWLFNFGIDVAAGVAVGVIFGILLEKPSMALRDRLFPSRARTAITPTATGS